MNAMEFLRLVRERSGVRNDARARRGISAVFSAVNSVLAHVTGHGIQSELPMEMRELWEDRFAEHITRTTDGKGPENLRAFLMRVQEMGDIATRALAENITRAVFATLHEQLPPEAETTIINQLPPSIAEFWAASTSVTFAPPDMQILVEIEDALEEAEDLDREALDILVEHGRVTVHGTVSTSAQRDRVGQVVASIAREAEVMNEVEVESEEE